MRPWSKNALMFRRWEIPCNNFVWWHRRNKRSDDDNLRSRDPYLHVQGTLWSSNEKHLRHLWQRLVEWPRGPCIVGRCRCFHANPRWTTAPASPVTYIRWRANWVPEVRNGVSIWSAALCWRPCGISGGSWWCRPTNKMSCRNAPCCEGGSSCTPRREEDRRRWNAWVKITTLAYDPLPLPTLPRYFDSIRWTDRRLCLCRKDLGYTDRWKGGWRDLIPNDEIRYGHLTRKNTRLCLRSPCLPRCLELSPGWSRLSRVLTTIGCSTFDLPRGTTHLPSLITCRWWRFNRRSRTP